MHDDLREEQKRTAIMLYAVQTAGSSLELDEVLRRVADSITLAVGGRYCCIYLLDEEHGMLVPSAEAKGTRNADRQVPRLPCLTPERDPLIQELLEEKAPVTCRDARSDPRVSDQTAQALGWISVLAVPIRIGYRVLGAAIVSTFKKPYFFTNEQIALCSGIANAVAIAIENARLYRQVEQLAVMEERQRLARELHDSVTQSLFSITLYAEAASRMLAAQKFDTTAEHLRELQATAQEALREMRLLVFELRPPLLAEQGLVAALQSRLEGVERRAGLRAELKVVGEKRLPIPVEEELYGIAQEALNNVLKHAGAKHVMVRLEFVGQSALIEVRDDGAGFELASAGDRGGLGLRGMTERAQRVGGRLTVQSTPGEGTVVRVVVTYDPRDHSIAQLPAWI
jgi:signal transduction histidine kinase